jgi:hypothetical protein
MDHKGFQTITLVILEAFALHHFNKVHVKKCIKVINFNCAAKSKYEHGNNLHVIKVNSFKTKIVEILLFLVQLMFMHCHLIIDFVVCRVQHDVVYIDVVVMQVHGSMNKKYELLIVDGTRPLDIRIFSLLKELSSTYK